LLALCFPPQIQVQKGAPAAFLLRQGRLLGTVLAELRAVCATGILRNKDEKHKRQRDDNRPAGNHKAVHLGKYPVHKRKLRSVVSVTLSY
jgi:hypothetical protein